MPASCAKYSKMLLKYDSDINYYGEIMFVMSVRVIWELDKPLTILTVLFTVLFIVASNRSLPNNLITLKVYFVLLLLLQTQPSWLYSVFSLGSTKRVGQNGRTL